jgi:phosphoglycolate phosphatase-like HAD superfamily hydrolase
MIGDHPSDIQMGLNVGCHTAYLLTGHGHRHLDELERIGLKPDFVVPNILAAARSIIEHEDKSG